MSQAPLFIRLMERFMEELVWMSTVLRSGRQCVGVVKQQADPASMHHANKSCPEMAARMGTDVMDTMIQVSTSAQ